MCLSPQIWLSVGKWWTSQTILRPCWKSYSRKPSDAVEAIKVKSSSDQDATSMSDSLTCLSVETFFHKHGHMMHVVLSSQSKHSLQAWAWSAGPWPGGVEQDFLEVPSMMLENCVWQPDVLKRLSKGPADGAPLPDSMIEESCQSHCVVWGSSRSRCLALTLCSLKVHCGPGLCLGKGNSFDSCRLYDAMTEDVFGVAKMPGTFGVASWFHPMMGYDARHCSHTCSKTLAADLFSEFENSTHKTVIDPELGSKCKRSILSPCAMGDSNSMLFNFSERKATNEAFLKCVASNLSVNRRQSKVVTHQSQIV